MARKKTKKKTTKAPAQAEPKQLKVICKGKVCTNCGNNWVWIIIIGLLILLLIYLSTRTGNGESVGTVTGKAYTASLAAMITCPTGTAISGDSIVVRVQSAQGEGCAEVRGALFYQLKEKAQMYDGLENVPIRAVNTQSPYIGKENSACRCDANAFEFVVTGLA